MLLFREQQIEGFGSILKPLLYNWGKRGLNIITAKNGFGKTTLLSSLSWILWGKMLNNNSTVQTWEHLRGDAWNGTMGYIQFKKDNLRIEVIRCLGYKLKI